MESLILSNLIWIQRNCSNWHGIFWSCRTRALYKASAKICYHHIQIAFRN